jgi:hypothetical protein|tara:strand:+ start:2632 stop:3069 length:438 start_codon:yes stop_codon:yes gene_type:complete
MTDVKCLAYQYLGSKRKKKEIDTQIKKLEQQLLDTEELGNLKLLLSNEGGQKTYQGITVETKRDHVWDQDRLHEVFSTLSNEDLPECVTVKKTTTYKIDYRAFQSFAMSHPNDKTVELLHSAHSIKLGDHKIKEINQEKLTEAEE